MKWDIDKALSALESGGSGTIIETLQVDLTDTLVLKQLGLKPTPYIRRTYERFAPVRVLGVGKLQARKLFFHGWTIREAFLKARRTLQQLSKSELDWYGVVIVKKRNSFASARRKKRT